MNDKDLAYMAGLFDGEGSIGIYRQATPRTRKGWVYRSQINISNTNLEVLEYVKSLLGGTIYHLPQRSKAWKDAYEWRATTQLAANILQLLLPALRIKQERAQLLIQYQELKNTLAWRGRRGYTPEQWRSLRFFYDEMHKLNT